MFSNDLAGDVHDDLQHQQLPATRGLHEGYRRLVQHVRVLRVPRAARVRPGQLCGQGRCKVGYISLSRM